MRVSAEALWGSCGEGHSQGAEGTRIEETGSSLVPSVATLSSQQAFPGWDVSLQGPFVLVSGQGWMQ